MEVKLSGRQGDRLISAESAIAERVEIRSGPDTPAPVGLALAPSKPVYLKRNGPHIRLIGLRKALVAYDTLPVTLVFRNAGRINVDVLVEESTAARKP